MPRTAYVEGSNIDVPPVNDVAVGLLIEAGVVLASSLELPTTMGQVAQLTVPRLSDLCVIDLCDEDGSIRDVAVAAADETIPGALEALRARHPLDPHGEHPVARVIRSGEPELLPVMTEMLLSSFAQGNEHARFMIDHGYHSAVVVPLLARHRTLGAISVLRLGDGESYGEEDLELVHELARRAALAIDNARLYTERTRIAHTLQQALLPESLPEIPGVEIQARYCAAGELNEVGGDFYDVFEYGADRWMLVIGDVCGKGPRAAGVTALARHTLRAAAMIGQSPTEMLETLHRALRRQPKGTDLCTVGLVALSLAPPVQPPGQAQAAATAVSATAVSAAKTAPFAQPVEAAGLTVALAGHLPPLLIDGNGMTRGLGQPGTLLGVLDPIEITESPAELRQGETLLLYTDGVPEAGRASSQLGEQGLLDLCAEAPDLTLGGLLERIEHAALDQAEGKLRDDIALLAVRMQLTPSS